MAHARLRKSPGRQNREAQGCTARRTPPPGINKKAAWTQTPLGDLNLNARTRRAKRELPLWPGIPVQCRPFFLWKRVSLARILPDLKKGPIIPGQGGTQQHESLHRLFPLKTERRSVRSPPHLHDVPPAAGRGDDDVSRLVVQEGRARRHGKDLLHPRLHVRHHLSDGRLGVRGTQRL